MDKISPIKERIIQFIEIKGIAKSDFCDKTGISYANMKGKSLQSEMGGSHIAEILSIYDEISSEWLLTGKGEMLKHSISEVNTIINEPALTLPKCKHCEEKERLIREKEERIQELKETITILKGNCTSKRNSA